MQTAWLLGGLGLGVGLMYLLDPEKGAERRDVVRGLVEDYGRQPGDFFDDTRRTVGRQAQAALASARTRVPFRRQPGLSLGICLVGTVGLGVGLGYLLEPQGGPQRRARLYEKARAYWRPTRTSNASRQEWRKAWRFFQGQETQRVDAHTRKPAQAQAWYAEPKDYESHVLYSEPFVTREEAEAWARAQDKP
jgi:hypothetical protein